MTLPGPLSLIRHLWRHHYLIGQLVRREVLLKYRGSYLGIGWSFLYPLILLAAFTLVFGHVFGARWPQPSHGDAPLALTIYCGLIVFTPFSEIVSAAPRLIHSHQNYVKKIVFPTEILPVSLVLSACIHAAINLGIFLAALLIFVAPTPSILLLPIVLLPAMLFAFGLAWILAAAGVFVRDLAHVMPVFVQLLLFLSPVFYPISAVPPSLHWFYQANPLGLVIEDLRRIMLWGAPPLWNQWFLALIVGGSIALLGYAFFRRVQEEFADVL
jgi:lipopolysaccharide transport system permease protein